MMYQVIMRMMMNKLYKVTLEVKHMEADKNN